VNDLEPSLYVQIEAQVGPLRVDAEFAAHVGPLVVIGPNGAGKTSLLSLILGVRPLTRGRVSVGGTVLFDSSARVDMPIEERRLGYVPQDYALFPHLNVRANVEFAIRSADPACSRAHARARAESMLGELGLSAHAARGTDTLSGGEKQRVALARALSIRPRAMLLDEPLAALDVHSRRQVRGFLGDYLRSLELPTVVVTHDRDDARALASRIAVLEAGRITQVGTWEELAERPASRFIAEFTSAE
jgi:molybdate transport system ATP-binding protein